MIRVDSQEFCNLVQYYVAYHKMQPLSAKVYALIIYDHNRVGITFDDLLTTFNCSKSSLSDSINELLRIGYVIGFSIDKSRKRYFISNDNYLENHLGFLNKMLQTEYEVLGRIIDSQRQTLNQRNKIIKRSKIYHKMLSYSLKHINGAIKKIKSIEK